MNPIARVLDRELHDLLDRLSAAVPPGCVEALHARHPSLRSRLDEVESHLAALRAAMLEAYGRWQRELEELENLWALAACRSTAEEPAEQAASLAA